ncbi:MAG: hypothetical protein V3S69_06940 [Dehalococcoidales bacterium]
MKTKKIKLPNGKTATLVREHKEVEIAAHLDKAIGTAVKEIKEALPSEADLSAVEDSLAALEQKVMGLQAFIESLPEPVVEMPEIPEIPMDEIRAAVKNSVQGIQFPRMIGPEPRKPEYTFEIIRDKDGFIDSVKATPQ